MSMELKTMNYPTLPSNYRSCFHNTISKHPPFLRWKAEMQKTTSNGGVSSEQNSVHVVKDGETLTSISKIPEVSISEIAAPNELGRPVGNIRRQSDQILVSCSKHSSMNLFASATSPKFLYARTTGYFLLLPLIAFCIRCIMGSLHHRVFGAPKHRTETDPTPYPRFKSERWKSALCDLDPDTKDCFSSPDSNHFGDEDNQLHDEDAAEAYLELERDYQKFLSQCGMSRQGYWRGGSS